MLWGKKVSDEEKIVLEIVCDEKQIIIEDVFVETFLWWQKKFNEKQILVISFFDKTLKFKL